MTTARPPWRIRGWLHAALLLAVWLGMLAAPVRAGTLSLAGDSPHTLEGSGKLEVLRDPSGTLDVDGAAMALAAGQFRAIPGNLTAGFTPDAFWLALTVDRPAQASRDWLLEVQPAYLDDVRLYVPREGRFDMQRAGDLLPQSQKLPHSGALFRLTLPQGETRILLRIKTTSTMTVIPRLWTPAAFADSNSTWLLVQGGYCGLLLTILLFSLLNGVMSGRKVFFLYGAYVLGMGLNWTTVNGLIGRFVLPEHPALSDLLTPLSVCFNILMGLLFYDRQFRLDHYLPWLHRFYVAMMLLALVTMGSVFFDAYVHFAPWMMMGLMTIILLSFAAIRQQLKLRRLKDRLGTLAYLGFFALAPLNLLSVTGVLQPTLWTLVYAGQSSSLPQLLLLHVTILLGVRRADWEKKRAQEQADHARRIAEQQQQAHENQRQFLAMVTHEIRTPISIIDAANESLRMLDDHGDAARRRRYDRIARAVQRIRRLVEMAECHDTARIEGLNASGLTLSSLHLAELVRGLLPLLSDDAEARLSIRAMPDLPPVVADAQLLRFTLLNLIDNALKYAAEATPITIDIASTCMDDGTVGAKLRVTNQGTSIPHHDWHRVFEKHVRLGESTGKPGLGLGLYFCHTIIARHGGTLKLETPPVPGACFVITLPLVPARQETSPQ